MSFGSWNVRFVHPQQDFQATPALYQRAKNLLGRLGSLLYESIEESYSCAQFNPRETGVPLSSRDAGRAGHVPFSVFVWYAPQPLPEEQHNAQRYCRSCSGLVPTLAKCARCGKQEDPMAWNIGPPLVLYTRTFEVGYAFEGAPDLCRETDSVIETSLRAYLNGVIEQLELETGSGFVMHKFAGE